MKKLILFLVLIFSSLLSRTQNLDSSFVSVTLAAKDYEFISSIIYTNINVEQLKDSMVVKMRVGNPPNNNTPVTITAMIKDWVIVYELLQESTVANVSGIYSRITTQFNNSNNQLMINKMQSYVDYYDQMYLNMRQGGKRKLRRG